MLQRFEYELRNDDATGHSLQLPQWPPVITSLGCMIVPARSACVRTAVEVIWGGS